MLFRSDSARIQRIIVHAERLMRQPPFDELFPSRHVRWWGRKARAAIREAKYFAQSADMDRGFALVVQALSDLPPGTSRMARASAWLCRKTLSTVYRLARRLVVWSRLTNRGRTQGPAN